MSVITPRPGHRPPSSGRIGVRPEPDDPKADWRRSPAAHAVERAVIGDQAGAASYTTAKQADRIADHLGLRPGVRVLDIGAGEGWPGLRFAARYGCEVVLTDLARPSVAGLRTRAAEQGLLGRASPAVASGTALPFPDAAFDVVLHSDLMC